MGRKEKWNVGARSQRPLPPTLFPGSSLLLPLAAWESVAGDRRERGIEIRDLYMDRMGSATHSAGLG